MNVLPYYELLAMFALLKGSISMYIASVRSNDQLMIYTSMLILKLVLLYNCNYYQLYVINNIHLILYLFKI